MTVEYFGKKYSTTKSISGREALRQVMIGLQEKQGMSAARAANVISQMVENLRGANRREKQEEKARRDGIEAGLRSKLA